MRRFQCKPVLSAVLWGALALSQAALKASLEGAENITMEELEYAKVEAVRGVLFAGRCSLIAGR